jgi:hypothetical protein
VDEVDRLMELLLAALLIVATDVPFVAFLVLVARRLLGLQIGLLRAMIAAVVENLVWFAAGTSIQPGAGEPISLALVTVQIGLALVGRWRLSPLVKRSSQVGPGCRS